MYQHQYRAMFVVNCVVRRDQILRFPPVIEPKSKKKKAKQRKSDTVGIDNDYSQAAACSLENTDSLSFEETFNPVMCSECNTEVGVYDSQEIYHFFNVLASHS